MLLGAGDHANFSMTDSRDSLSAEFLEYVANAFTIGRIHLVKEIGLSLDNVLWNALHGLGEVGEKPGFLTLVEQVEQGPGLTVIVISLAMVVAVRLPTLVRNLALAYFVASAVTSK